MNSQRYEGSLSDRFTIDGIEFVIDVTAGKDRRPSQTDSFTLVKTPGLIQTYFSLANRLKPKSILEFGVFQGGSLVLLDRVFQPETLVGIEIDPSFAALRDYCAAQTRNVNVYFQTSQADADAFAVIIANDFKNGIDLVVDDASHTFELTRKSLELAWPHLNVGGTYVIEDWAWAHGQPAQDAAHTSFDMPALTNLIFELIVDLGSHSNIRSIAIDRGKAIIVKGGNGEDFLEPSRMRDRPLLQI